MKLHELKILDTYWGAVWYGDKTFELRKNDRDYQKGDLIHFSIISKDEPNSITPTHQVYQITYVLKDVPQYGLDKDYCILGIKKLEVR